LLHILLDLLLGRRRRRWLTAQKAVKLQEVTNLVDMKLVAVGKAVEPLQLIGPKVDQEVGTANMRN
jgi:hypothetical protein